MVSNNRKKIFWSLILLLIISLLGILTYKTYLIASQARRTVENIQLLRDLPSSIPKTEEDLDLSIDQLSLLRSDLIRLRGEVSPLFPFTKTLGWLPRFSWEAQHARDLLEMAISLSDVGISTLNAVKPTISLLESPNSAQLIADLPIVLSRSSPDLQLANDAYQHYLNLRNSIDVDQMDPLTQEVFSQLDTFQPVLTSSLQLADEVPALLGFSGSKPLSTTFGTTLSNDQGAKFLLIFQNEDELRATGGFVTAIGILSILDGKPNLGNFVDSPTADDFEHIYPPPPFWIGEYMQADYLLLRDANWEIDYPQAALSMAHLYSFYDTSPLTGVIAMDQKAIVELLRLTGPISVNGFDQPVSTDTLIDQLRLAKQADASLFGGEVGERKAFLQPVAFELLRVILNNPNNSFENEDLIKTFLKAMDQKHILLSLFTPAAAQIIQQMGWDGSIEFSANSDGVMVVDSNIGFNKSNALVERQINYSVDLVDPGSPSALLNISHTHTGNSEQPCQQWGADNPQALLEYPMERCYYNYLRVAIPSSAELLESQTYPVSGLLGNRFVPERVDELTDRLKGGQVLGTLMVLPGNSSLTHTFHFSLPKEFLKVVPLPTKPKAGSVNELIESILSPTDQTSVARRYDLRLFKQPGHHSEDVTFTLRLPSEAVLISAHSQPELPAPAISTDPTAGQIIITWQFAQLTDTTFTVLFQ